MATRSTFLAWKSTRTEEPGRLQSMRLQKSRTCLSGYAHTHTRTHTHTHTHTHNFHQKQNPGLFFFFLIVFIGIVFAKRDHQHIY